MHGRGWRWRWLTISLRAPPCSPRFPLAAWARWLRAWPGVLALAPVGAHCRYARARALATHGMDRLLHRAACKGDATTVVACLRDGAEYRGITEHGWTALHGAVFYRRVAVAEVLVHAGWDVNAQTFRGYTPLHWACGEPESGLCSLLLQAGADVDAANKEHSTPLHSAAAAGSVNCTAQLLAAGADTGRRDRAGNTPVDIASRYGQHSVVSLLRDAAVASARWGGLRRVALTAWCWQR